MGVTAPPRHLLFIVVLLPFDLWQWVTDRPTDHDRRLSPRLIGSFLISHAQTSLLMGKQWKKEQASRRCTADVCLRQSVNQLYNNQKNGQTCSFFHCLPIILTLLSSKVDDNQYFPLNFTVPLIGEVPRCLLTKWSSTISRTDLGGEGGFT